MAQHTGLEVRDIEVMFTQQSGYATPKLGVRGALFREDRVLLVRETADEHRWTLPGGWADVNESPAEAVAREVREEFGLEVRPYKLAAVWDRARHPHGVIEPFHIWRLFFLCEITGGETANWTRDQRGGFLRGARIAGRAIDAPGAASPTEAHVRAHASTGPANRVRLSTVTTVVATLTFGHREPSPVRP